jgi:hypothetical protein
LKSGYKPASRRRFDNVTTPTVYILGSLHPIDAERARAVNPEHEKPHHPFLDSRNDFHVLTSAACVIISPQDLKDGAKDKLPWPRGERAGDHLGIKSP